MAKMRNPPLQAVDDTPDDDVNNGAGPSNSKRKGKRKRDESVDAASEVSVVVDEPLNVNVDVDVDDGERPTSPSKSKRRRKKKKKGPITVNETTSDQVAVVSGTNAPTNASRNGTPKAVLAVDVSKKVDKVSH